MKLSNIFCPTAKHIKKFSVAMKGFLGVIATSAFFDGNTKAAFWILVAGALLDAVLSMLDEDTQVGKRPIQKRTQVPSPKVKVNSSKYIKVLFIACLALSAGCRSRQPRPIMNNETTVNTDSTAITQSADSTLVPGVQVLANIDCDSILKLINEKEANIFNGLQHPKNEATGSIIITDPKSAIQLRFYKDYLGKLQVEASTKDSYINYLKTTILKLQKSLNLKNTTLPPVVVNKHYWWMVVLVWMFGILSIPTILRLIFKRSLF